MAARPFVEPFDRVLHPLDAARLEAQRSVDARQTMRARLGKPLRETPGLVRTARLTDLTCTGNPTPPILWVLEGLALDGDVLARPLVEPVGRFLDRVKCDA